MQKRGRPPKKENERRKCVGISMDPESYNALMFLSKNLDMKPSSVCKYLINEAKKDQTLRNIIRNQYVAGLRANNANAWKKIRNTKEGYITTIRKDGSLYTYFKPSEEITVDHQSKNTTEEVSNEEIDALWVSLGYTTLEEFKETYGHEPKPLKAYESQRTQQSNPL